VIITNKFIIQHIPKTAGSALRKAFGWQSNINNIDYITTHRPLTFLNTDGMIKYRDSSRQRVAVIREPKSWYNSWWNYTRKKDINCSLSFTMHHFSKNQDEFIENALDLTRFFSKYQEANFIFKKNSVNTPFNHLHHFISDFNFTPEYFNNCSLYQFYLRRQIDSTFKLFRFEELSSFLDFIEFNNTSGDLPKANLTKYSEPLAEKNLRKIEKEEEVITSIYSSGIVPINFHRPEKSE